MLVCCAVDERRRILKPQEFGSFQKEKGVQVKINCSQSGIKRFFFPPQQPQTRPRLCFWQSKYSTAAKISYVVRILNQIVQVVDNVSIGGSGGVGLLLGKVSTSLRSELFSFQYFTLLNQYNKTKFRNAETEN